MTTPNWPNSNQPALPSRPNWQRKSIQLPYATDAGETDAPEIIWGTGSPEGVLLGVPGDRYIATDSGDYWYKRSGTGSTGWSKFESGLRLVMTQSGLNPDSTVPARFVRGYTSNALARTAQEIIAHRGAGTNGSGSAAPENTLVAVGLAAGWAQGMETDVQMTSDGVAVCIHDTTVDRTTNGTGAVSSFTLAAIQALDAGTKFDAKFAGARVPKFKDWLIAASQASRLLYPEIKGYRTTADIAVMMQVILDLDLADRCVVQSFNGLVDFPFMRAVSTRLVAGYVVSDPNLWAAALAAAIADGNAVMIAEQSMLIANPTFITNARAGGVDVIAWTVDSSDTVRLLTALGIRRIMSNRILRSFVAA